MKEWQENEEPGSLFIQEQERTCMKKELEYFYIENSFGGNQDWFRDYWMHMGGCAAAAACDSCISMEKAGVKKKLYPFDIKNLNKSDYLDFSMLMKPYLRPRLKGIDRLDIRGALCKRNNLRRIPVFVFSGIVEQWIPGKRRYDIVFVDCIEYFYCGLF